MLPSCQEGRPSASGAFMMLQEFRSCPGGGDIPILIQTAADPQDVREDGHVRRIIRKVVDAGRIIAALKAARK